jgi:hypothetical protein
VFYLRKEAQNYFSNFAKSILVTVAKINMPTLGRQNEITKEFFHEAM